MGCKGEPQRNGSEFGGAQEVVKTELRLRRLTAVSSCLTSSSSLLSEMTPFSDKEDEVEL